MKAKCQRNILFLLTHHFLSAQSTFQHNHYPLSIFSQTTENASIVANQSLDTALVAASYPRWKAFDCPKESKAGHH